MNTADDIEKPVGQCWNCGAEIYNLDRDGLCINCYMNEEEHHNGH